MRDTVNVRRRDASERVRRALTQLANEGNWVISLVKAGGPSSQVVKITFYDIPRALKAHII
jgi:hypothetical protein